jgi:hypothetical protein
MTAARIFTTREREQLFLRLASTPDGATAPDVHKEAESMGDKVTPEAYQNIARRLVHRGVLVANEDVRPIKYKAGQNIDGHWLEEEELAAWVSDEYPLLALPIWKESQRQLRDIPEEVWILLREKLMAESARELFQKAIVSYCDYLDALLRETSENSALGADPRELSKQKAEARNGLLLLRGLVQYGLGLSIEAVGLPESVEQALEELEAKSGVRPVKWDEDRLREELLLRVTDEKFMTEVQNTPADRSLVAAVDASTRGGVLSFLGEETDFYVGHAPMISINTSVGQVNRKIVIDGREFPVFMRLPEKPEDIQQRDNRYTVMAKLFYPDLSDAQFMHSLWNAMEALQCRTTLRVLSRWYTSKGSVEIPPADVVLRDGTTVPQDRDFNHYADETRYGEIVRDIISTNWEIVKKCQADAQTVGGVVKNAQLRVFGPIFNWYASQLAAKKGLSFLESWPLAAMNNMPDQVLLTRLLTAGRNKIDRWVRTCLVFRPFHATNPPFATHYSVSAPPPEIILQRRDRELAAHGTGTSAGSLRFWRDFRGKADPYVQMLNTAWYANYFLASVPRLDFERYLPRIELLVASPVYGAGADPVTAARPHLERLIGALRQTGFEVSADHSMYRDKSTLEVLPSLVTRAHDTVKIWAQELLSRVDEYLSAILTRVISAKRARGVRIRPFTKEEFRLLHEALKQERLRLVGASESEELDS